MKVIQLNVAVCEVTTAAKIILYLHVDSHFWQSDEQFPEHKYAFWIYLTIFGTARESKRSISVMKQISNWTRRPSSHSLLSAECELLHRLNTDELISKFVNKKCKKHFI
jgi:hypothetical protein